MLMQECSLNGLAMLVAGMGALETEEEEVMNELENWMMQKDRWRQVGGGTGGWRHQRVFLSAISARVVGK